MWAIESVMSVQADEPAAGDGAAAAPGTASLDDVRDVVAKTLEVKGVLGSIKVRCM